MHFVVEESIMGRIVKISQCFLKINTYVKFILGIFNIHDHTPVDCASKLILLFYVYVNICNFSVGYPFIVRPKELPGSCFSLKTWGHYQSSDLIMASN